MNKLPILSAAYWRIGLDVWSIISTSGCWCARNRCEDSPQCLTFIYSERAGGLQIILPRIALLIGWPLPFFGFHWASSSYSGHRHTGNSRIYKLRSVQPSGWTHIEVSYCFQSGVPFAWFNVTGFQSWYRETYVERASCARAWYVSRPTWHKMEHMSKRSNLNRNDMKSVRFGRSKTTKALLPQTA
jgi:hypothetical protein